MVTARTVFRSRHFRLDAVAGWHDRSSSQPVVSPFPEFSPSVRTRRAISASACSALGAAEATYRLVVQQLPPPPLPGKVIQILPGIDMPVSLPAVTPQEAGDRRCHGRAGTLSFALSDSGTAHILMENSSSRARRSGKARVGRRRRAVLRAGGRASGLRGADRRGDRCPDPDHRHHGEFCRPDPARDAGGECSSGRLLGAQPGLTGFANDTRQHVKILADSASQ